VVQPAALARTRAVTWEDPLISARAGASMSGIEYLRAIAQGKLPPPPIALLLGFDIDEVEEGRVVFTAETGEHQYNPIGVVHRGLAATLLDSAWAARFIRACRAGAATPRSK
jgi:acyl-coenzyme A thioesterase PaaI-like protein